MLSSINPFLPQTYNQTDRIQGMARYMNQDGANSELMTLLLIFAGMLTVILILRMIARNNQRKRQEALKQRLEKKRKVEAQAAAKTKVASKRTKRTHL
jgi:flagellar biosynthesis/type III secretory pathway M-ring protein FliF/YscJ